MASDNEASCESDPNFAVICAFMEKFGTTCGLQTVDFLELQEMLENTQEVPQELIDLHIKLLRKSRKTVSNERWEKAIIKFCHSFCVQDAWEIERFGYKKARLSSKLRVLKELLEMQFDYNARFKAEINKMSAEELRSQPLGKDKHGHAYWFQNDNNCQIRVYKEDPDEETWTLVAKDRDGLTSLISDLSDGDSNSKISSESALNEEDSNSLAEKPIIDTGQVDSSNSSDSVKKEESESSNESKEENGKRERESDEEEEPAKKKIEVSEAVEEPIMLVKGEGAGEDNCENPIVGEAIEEEVMFVYGVGNGADCFTGNEDKAKAGGSNEKSDSQALSISDLKKNCVNDGVPTSPMKNPYKLGTIFDTKTDNKIFGAVKNPTKKSRWDVETIMAKEESPPVANLNEEKKMFFFGPGCLQFKSPTSFGQKVPPEKNENLEVQNEKAKGDVGYRIEESEEEKAPIVDRFSVISAAKDSLEEAKVEAIPKQDVLRNIEDQVVSEESQVDGGRIPSVTAALLGIQENYSNEEIEESVLENEEICVKKHAYVCGNEEKSEGDVKRIEELPKVDENENQSSMTKIEEKREDTVHDSEMTVEETNVENNKQSDEIKADQNEHLKIDNLTKEEVQVEGIEELKEETVAESKCEDIEDKVQEQVEAQSVERVEPKIEESKIELKDERCKDLDESKIEESSSECKLEDQVENKIEDSKDECTMSEECEDQLETKVEEKIEKQEEEQIEDSNDLHIECVSEEREVGVDSKKQSTIQETEDNIAPRVEESEIECNEDSITEDNDEKGLDQAKDLSEKEKILEDSNEKEEKVLVSTEADVNVEAEKQIDNFEESADNQEPKIIVEESKVERIEEEKVETVVEGKVDKDEEEKVEEFKAESVEKVVEEKVEKVETENVEELEAEAVEKVEEEKVDEFEAENVEKVQAEKVDEFEAEKVEKVQAEKVDEFEEEKVEKVEAEKVDEFEAENVEIVQAEKVDEFEEEKVEKVQAEKVEEFEAEKVEKVEGEKEDKVEEQVEKVQAEKFEEFKAEEMEKVEEEKVEEVQVENVEKFEAEAIEKFEDVEKVETEKLEKVEDEVEEVTAEKVEQGITDKTEDEFLGSTEKCKEKLFDNLEESVDNEKSETAVEENTGKVEEKVPILTEADLTIEDEKLEENVAIEESEMRIDEEKTENLKETSKKEESDKLVERTPVIEEKEDAASLHFSTLTSEIKIVKTEPPTSEKLNKDVICEENEEKLKVAVEITNNSPSLEHQAVIQEALKLDQTEKILTELEERQIEENNKNDDEVLDLKIESKPEEIEKIEEKSQKSETEKIEEKASESEKIEEIDKIEEETPNERTEETVPHTPAKRGRKNNSSEISNEEEKKPRMVTRRTRSSKTEDIVETVEEKPTVPQKQGRRGRPSKKRRTVNVEKKEETEKTEEKSSDSHESTPNANETVIVESSNSSSDVVELPPEKDPLAVSEDEKEEETKKPMSLATFSLDFTESPTSAPVVTRGQRKRGRESPQNAEEIEESGAKRAKVRGKRAADLKLRKSIEQQKKAELVSSDEDSKNEDKVEKKKKKGEENDDKKNHNKSNEETVLSSDAEKEKKKKAVKNKNKRLLSNLGINLDQVDIENQPAVGVRQSRRIAQLKIKEEAERRKLEEEIVHESHKKKKSKKHEDKDYKVEKKKLKEVEEEEVDEDSSESKKKKRKKKKHRKLFDELNPWRSSSDSSSSNEEEEIGEEEEEEDDEVLQYVSDHEFSPESDMEGDGEALPLKRARTARKESDIEEVDDCPCQKCGKSDHPEWILLCDSCDNGWHCSCLRPPLLVIPEGDWFCPPCQHSALLKNLEAKLKEYDQKLNKKEIEDRRKQRLAYVGISLNNVLPAKEGEHVKKRRLSEKEEDDDEDDDEEDDDDDDDAVGGEADASSSEESESGTATPQSASDSDEPIYQLRQRRQAHSYRFNDYDDLIDSAIQEEMDAVKGAGNQGRGKDIATIVNAEKDEERSKEEPEESTTGAVPLEPLPPVVPVNDRDKEARPIFEENEEIKKKKIVGRKKHRKLNALDISDDDDEDSDEDFKGTSEESDDDFDEDLGSEDSDDLDTGRRGRRSDPVRRSTRARTSRYDADFIDDGESESEDEAPRRKKKRSFWDESESEESDRSWGRRKRKPTGNRSRRNPTKSASSSSKKKKSKKKKKQQDSDEEVYKKKKPKIKFGFDGDDDGPVRRTRGKKINYVDALGSDSDEDRVKRPPPRIDSDEEYVAEEDQKLSEEENDSGDENNAKQQKIQIKSYTDARFTQLLPEPKNLVQDGEVESELNPIDQINRNVEMMDENEMEKMMEEEEYANKQLQMVALQLEKEKRRKEKEAKKVEPQQPPIEELLQNENKGKKKEHFQFSAAMQEPLVGNVDNLIVNSENNDELSEPPGVSLPLFAELGDNLEEQQKKRRGKNKKSLEEAVANLGSGRPEVAPPFIPKNLPTDLSVPQDANIEIAAPPQPFSQSQPAPSVITRMLQSKPGQPGYPVGAIRPKQFATMPGEREEEHVMTQTQYLPGTAALRAQLTSPFRQLPPYPPRSSPAPPPIRNPVPPHIYHGHRPLDPSPSGGGLSEPGRVSSPAAPSPGGDGKTPPPPPPYSRPAPRFPGAPPSRPHLQMLPPRPANLSPYHPGLPPQYHYGGQFAEEALPPPMYQGSPYSGEFDAVATDGSGNSKGAYDEETGGGEFGGLVSYFSSQREDDLES